MCFVASKAVKQTVFVERDIVNVVPGAEDDLSVMNVDGEDVKRVRVGKRTCPKGEIVTLYGKK